MQGLPTALDKILTYLDKFLTRKTGSLPSVPGKKKAPAHSAQGLYVVPKDQQPQLSLQPQLLPQPQLQLLLQQQLFPLLQQQLPQQLLPQPLLQLLPQPQNRISRMMIQ